MDGPVSQVSVDGLTWELLPGSNLTPPLRAVAAAPNRPVLVTDQSGRVELRGRGPGDLAPDWWAACRTRCRSTRADGASDALLAVELWTTARPVDNSAGPAAVGRVPSSRSGTLAACPPPRPLLRRCRPAFCSPPCSTCSCPAPAAAAPRPGRGGAPAAPPGSARSGGRCCPAARRSWRPAGTAGRCARRCSRTRSAGGGTSPVRWPRCSAGALAQAAGPAQAWLVPAPSRPAAARARGGDHVLRLCRHLARADPRLRVSPALRLGRRARDSVGLDAAARVGEPGRAAPGRRRGTASGAARR